MWLVVLHVMGRKNHLLGLRGTKMSLLEAARLPSFVGVWFVDVIIVRVVDIVTAPLSSSRSIWGGGGVLFSLLVSLLWLYLIAVSASLQVQAAKP